MPRQIIITGIVFFYLAYVAGGLVGSKFLSWPKKKFLPTCQFLPSILQRHLADGCRTTVFWKCKEKGVTASKPRMSFWRKPIVSKTFSRLETSGQNRCFFSWTSLHVRRREHIQTTINRHSETAFQLYFKKELFGNPGRSSKSTLRHLSTKAITVTGGDKEGEKFTASNRTFSSTNSSYSDCEGKASSKFFEQDYDDKIDKMGKDISEYERLVRRLYQINLFHPVKMGLTNMEKLHDLIGAPMNDTSQRFVIHVAGTNGKGSVSLKIAKILEDAGYRTGLFVSPHISSFRERMQVNSVPITEEEVCELLPEIYSLCQTHDIPATFFEVTTALAFRFFQHRNVDAVVLETGLGGRLDATNVVTHPALSIITSIGLEHTRILGDTIDKICFEKAGIIKPQRPTLIGPGVQPVSVVESVCQERGSELVFADDLVPPSTFTMSSNETLTSERQDTTMVDYDIENSRIATAAVHILIEKGQLQKMKHPVTEENILHGISHRPPCRFEIISWTPSPTSSSTSTAQLGVPVVLDVAHNPPALKFLLAKLRHTFGQDRPVRFVVGFSSDKDLAQCGNLLLTYMDEVSRTHKDNENKNDTIEGFPSIEKKKRIHLVQAAHPRAATSEQMLEACPGLANESYLEAPTDDANANSRGGGEIASSITSHVKSALNIAYHENEVVVICGSVFIMSDAREALGIEEARDSSVISEVAGINLRHGQENFGNSTNTI